MPSSFQQLVCFLAHLSGRTLQRNNEILNHRIYKFLCVFFLYRLGDFRIDNSGTVFVSKGLDRERHSAYTLEVRAYNYRTKVFNETSRPRQRNVDGRQRSFELYSIFVSFVTT